MLTRRPDSLEALQNRKLPLSWILAIPFVIQIGVAVGLTGWLSLRNGERAVNDLAKHIRTDASEKVFTHLSHYLASPQQINEINLAAFELGWLDLNNFDHLGQFFWQQMQAFDVGYINFANESGEFLGVERLDSGEFLVNETHLPHLNKMAIYPVNSHGQRRPLQEISEDEPDIRQEDWYADAAKAQKPVWSCIYQWDDKPEVLSISSSYPLFDQQQHFLGVMGVDLILTQINEFLRSIQVSPNSEIFIIEQTGQLVASSALEPAFKRTETGVERLNVLESRDPQIRATAQFLKAHFDRWETVRQNHQLEFTVQGTRRFVSVLPWHEQSGLTWLIVVVVPESDFMATIHANTRMTVALCLMALFWAIVISWQTSQWLVKPLLRTIYAADALSQGDWQQRLPESHSQEITLLSKAFNNMAGQLQDSFTTLQHVAYYDTLTGLLNRNAFWTKLQEAIEAIELSSTAISKPIEPKNFAVLLLDLDYFKLVNDSLGHLFGDQLLIQVAKRLNTCVRPQDVVGRLGGDEFVILIKNVADLMEVTEIADRIVNTLEKPFELSGNEIFISASIGIVMSTLAIHSPETFLQYSDTALYRAKAKGKACYQVFSNEMHTETVERFQLESDLQKAIELQELALYYQPILSVETQEITGFEALMRWHHPQKGLISPAKFIPIAEETGLVVKLGWWALQEACAQLYRWQQQFSIGNSWTMSVNLSGKQFFQTDLVESLQAILVKTGLTPQCLKLEITESIFMNSQDAVRLKLKRLRQIGIQLSLDDFGTGYSSLSYLNHFPVNTLKIDPSFISRLTSQPAQLGIVEVIIILARRLGMDVVAEGVETSAQLSILRQLGCHQVQGYLFAPPLPVTELETWLEEHQRGNWRIGAGGQGSQGAGINQSTTLSRFQ